MEYKEIIKPYVKYLYVCLGMLCFTCGTNTLEITTKDNYEVAYLPDGSAVYLNHNSTIKYDKEFDPRTIELNGEAFFTVITDESIFLVTTEFGDIEVLGTEFNVKTAANQVEVDVKSGLVELKTEYNNSKVKKGFKAVYKEGDKKIQEIKSNKEFRKWTRSLKSELKRLGKDLKPLLKNVDKEFKKAGQEISKELKKSKN
jgi:ferric-dicitrate binding protein FerR (iron transport regulator)